MRQPGDEQRARDDERGGEDHERPEKFDDAVPDAETGAGDDALQRLAIGIDGRHQFVARDVRAARYERDDAVAARLEIIDDLRQRRDASRERSPPASCSSTMLPSPRSSLTRWTISSAPGRAQSCGSIFSSTMV